MFLRPLGVIFKLPEVKKSKKSSDFEQIFFSFFVSKITTFLLFFTQFSITFFFTNPMMSYFFRIARYMFNSHSGNLPHVSTTSWCHFKSSKVKNIHKNSDFDQIFFSFFFNKKIRIFLLFFI